jgi:hypothetical protein
MLRAIDLPEPDNPLMITICMSVSIAEACVYGQAGLDYTINSAF